MRHPVARYFTLPLKFGLSDRPTAVRKANNVLNFAIYGWFDLFACVFFIILQWFNRPTGGHCPINITLTPTSDTTS